MVTKEELQAQGTQASVLMPETLCDCTDGSGGGLTTEEKEALEAQLDDKADKAEVIAALNKKVDKVDGKVLSTNDFTNVDKQKLDSLNNYDDTQITSAITGLESELNEKADKHLVYTKTEIDGQRDVINNSLKVLNTNKADKEDVYTKDDTLSKEQTFTILADKVDKEEGKQLSTEDFTTVLKQKLEQLAVDVPDIDTRLSQLKTTLDTLIDDGGIDAVINSFVEIEAFLAGVTNKETLTGLLQEMKSEITALCANTYLPLSGGKINSTVVAPIRLNTNKTQNVIVYTINDEDKTSVGYSETNGSYIYSYAANKRLGIKDNGTPHFDNKEILHTGNYSTIFKDTYVTTNTDQDIKGKKSFSKGTFELANDYSEPDSVVDVANGNTFNIGQGAEVTSTQSSTIKRGFQFNWYDTSWVIGNLRGGSTNSLGFAIAWVDKSGETEVYDLGLLVKKEKTYASGFATWSGKKSEFLKADGSVDSTAYVPQTQDFEISGNKTFKRPIIIDCDNDAANIIIAKSTVGGQATGQMFYNHDKVTRFAGIGSYFNVTEDDEGNKTIALNYNFIGWGTAPWSSGSCLAISPDRFTYKNKKVWHEGNDGAGSGLDADLLDGYNVARDSLLYKNYTSLNEVEHQYFKITFKNRYKSIDSTLLIRTTGDNSTSDCFIHAGAIDLGDYWGWLTRYNSAKVVGVCKESTIGTVSFYIKTNLTTSIAVYSSDEVTIENGDYSGKTYLDIKTAGLFASETSPISTAVALRTKQLTNEDLNDIKDTNFSCYFADGGNKCTNKPAGLDAFGLQVFRIASAYICQVITGTNGVICKRHYSGSAWTAWQQLATTDSTVAKANTFTEQTLTNVSLNNVKESGFYIKGANVTDIPPEVGDFTFQLQVNKRNRYNTQILTFNKQNNSEPMMLIRTLNSIGWTPWRRVITEADIAPLISRLEALENSIVSMISNAGPLI